MEDNRDKVENDSDSEDIPEWINQDYLEKLLKNYFKDDSIKVLNFYPKLASKKGENYASLITRVLIEYENKNLKYNIVKFIIKSSIEADAVIAKTIKEYQAFEDEMLIYNEVLPNMHELLRTRGGFNEISVFPKPIYCDFGKNAIILEDLKPQDYKSADRIIGLDEQHAKLALKKLAIFHACSVILDQSNPGCFKKFDHGTYNRYSDGISGFYCSLIHKVSSVIQNFGDEFINYSKKLRDLIPYWVEKERKCYDPKPNQLNVLAHGDFWSTNVMYKYDESGQPLDAILIDFQFSVWASPTIDLHHFFHTSLAGLPNIDEMENLIKYYYSEFLKTLKIFDFQKLSSIPSIDQFLLEFWVINGFHALQTAFLDKPISFIADNNVASPEALFDEGEKRERFQWAMVNNERVQEHWKILLPCFERKDLFNL